jgi:hypothetical protein
MAGHSLEDYLQLLERERLERSADDGTSPPASSDEPGPTTH